MDFAATIIAWYNQNKRDLPWRHTRDPYKIWLSEVILQQTRVVQGLSYYQKFTGTYASLRDLANADEEEVLRLWQGLGYYSRARNMLATAVEICNKYGSFPESYHEILSLKGIGPYTAAAISSFAFDLPYPVVDGNVSRVLSRYFGVDTPIDSSSGKKYFLQLAEELLPVKKAAIYNQAIMEFGALQCVPVNPSCDQCALRNSCIGYEKKMINGLPVKAKKTAVLKKWFYYFVIQHRNNYYIRKRTENSIWKNLYDFPLIEADQSLPDKKLLEMAEKKFKFEGSSFSYFPQHYKHQLSHRSIRARFIITRISSKKSIPDHLVPVRWGAKPEYAVPRLIDIFLEDLFKS